MNQSIPQWQGNEATMLGPVPTPEQLHAIFPISQEGRQAVTRHRSDIEHWQGGIASKLLVIVGPCSLDASTMEGQFAAEVFADRLFATVKEERLDQKLKVLLRLPPAKPRSELGWAGLEQTDVRTAVQILGRIANQGHPLAMEMMNEQQFARFGDRLALGWVGARTIEDPLLRRTVSAHPELSMLFKSSMHPDARNSLNTALSALRTSAAQHVVEVMRPNGTIESILSPGNATTGIIFRGTSGADPESFKTAITAAGQMKTFTKTGHINPRVRLVVDASHANARAHLPEDLDPSKPASMVAGQLACLASVTEMIADRESIDGVMIESNLVEGKGELPGQSKTDPCIDFDSMLQVLRQLASAQWKRAHWHREPGGVTY